MTLEPFRASMTWLHSYLGIAMGGVLFAIFWMGTLTVFDKEIDIWMRPEMRVVTPETFSLDEVLAPLLSDIEDETDYFFVAVPSARETLLRTAQRMKTGDIEMRYFSLETGAELDLLDSYGASQFFYPFHYELMLPWQQVGQKIVGLLGIAMLILLVSGVIIHRAIIRDFFTFRRRSKHRRQVLDIHNLTGTIALPFHFFMTFTGILIFIIGLFHPAFDASYHGNSRVFYEERLGMAFDRPLSGEPWLDVPSLDAIKATIEARRSQESGQTEVATWLRVANFGDMAAYIDAKQKYPSNNVSMFRHHTIVDAASGDILASSPAKKPFHEAEEWLDGLHYIQSEHWPLRWLYFIAGLLGCIMIATGNLFWLNSRVRKGSIDPGHVKILRGLTVGSTTGIIAASAVFLIANRLLARDVTLLGYGRADLEVWAFFLTWITLFCHAGARGRSAWSEQCWTIAWLGLWAVLLSWATTGDHILSTFESGLWSVVGVDVTLLTGSALAAWSAWTLRRPAVVVTLTQQSVAD